MDKKVSFLPSTF